MTKADAILDPILNPSLFALLACDLAGFNVESLFARTDDELPDNDFVIEFGIGAGLRLVIEHELESLQFVISCVADNLEQSSQFEAVALRMSHHLPATMRFSVDESQVGNLCLTQVIDVKDLSLETLALAISDASELMQLISMPSLLSDAITDRSRPTDITSGLLVRG